MDQTHPSVGQLPSYAGGSPFKGFWIRFVAAIADFVILVIMTLAIASVLAIIAAALLGEGAAVATFILTLIAFGIALILYKPLMEASEYQGTLGKHILGMKVVNQRGERITMTTSFVRTIVYLVLTTIPGVNVVGVLGLIMIGFTEQKQGLHDIAAKTFVVPKEWIGPIVSQDGFGA
jgi:uncharacterized RDD family membrane protein YckC